MIVGSHKQFDLITPVTFRPSPFATDVQCYRLPQGMTLAEIVAHCDVPAAFWTFGVIQVGGVTFSRETWGYVRPRHREGFEIAVTLAMVPQGGAVLQIVAQAALTGLTALAGAINPLLGAIVGIGGNFLMQMLFPPPKQKQPHARESISYGVSGNPAKPLEQLQRVLGRIEMAPPPLTNPYSTLNRQHVIVEAVVGLVGNHEVTNIKLNGTDIEDNQSVVSYQVREGTGLESDITICDRNAFEERPNTQLSTWILSRANDHEHELRDQSDPDSCDPQWHSFAGRGTCDELAIRLLFASGLVQTESDGPTHPAAVPVRMQLRKRGDADWINGPEFHWLDKSEITQEIRVQIKLMWATGGDIAAVTTDVNANIAYWNASPGETWEWEAHTYFNPGTGSLYATHLEQDDNGFTVYLDPGVFPPGEYEVRLKRGRSYKYSEFNRETYLYRGSPQVSAFFEYYDNGSGVWRVGEQQKPFVDAITVDAVTSISYDYPLPSQSDVPLTLIAVKVRNAQINSIAATFHSRVNTYNGANWATLETSSNPAALYRHVLKDDLNAKPLNINIINNDEIQEWYDACETAGYECNMVAAESVMEVLEKVAVAGWARPRQNEQWGVMREYDRSALSIVQNFTPLNSRGFTAEKPFTDIPHGIYAEFVDETREYRVENRTIYGDGYDASTATLFQSIRYESITDPAQIDARALKDWRQMFYRQTTRTIEIGAESLMSQRGDLVGLTHDVVGTKFFYGTIASLILGSAGVTVIGFKLDAVAELSQAGGACGVMVRYEDGTIFEAAIDTDTDTDTVILATPIAIPAGDVLRKGCLVALGLYGQVYKRMLIAGIRPVKDFAARLTLVDEAPEIHAVTDALTFDTDLTNDSGYIALF